MTRSQPFAVYSRTEVMLLLDLVREHAPHVRLRYEETERELRIMLETDRPELTRYMAFMLRRLRERQRRIEGHLAPPDVPPSA